MAKKVNPRRVALKILRDLRGWCSIMASSWDQPQSRVFPGEGWRRLREDEKLENRPEDWETLAKWMDAVARQASELRDYAREQRELAKARAGGEQ